MKNSSISVVLFLLLLPFNGITQGQDLKLWYTRPAEKWTEALPLGNGRIGAMVFGGVNMDHIQFNEETLWTGGPRDYYREGAVAYLPQLRQLLSEGKQKEAEALAEKHFMGKKYNEENFESLRKEWLAKVVNPQFSQPAYDDNSWKQMQLPTPNGWESTGQDGLDGSVWFRTSFELPQAWIGKSLVIQLGRIRDLDFTYINGRQIGSSEGNMNREYEIDATLLKEGKNTIAVHVINFNDKGGFVGSVNDKDAFVIYQKENSKNVIQIPSTWKYWIQDEKPPAAPRYQADYQPFGDLYLQFNHGSSVTNYKRELDITKAVSTVSYSTDGINYTREYFVSAPDQAIVMKIRSDKPGKISLKAQLKSAHRLTTTTKVNDNTLKLSLQVRNGVLRGACYLHAVTPKGKVVTTENDITIENSNEVIFYITAATSYVNYKDVSGDPAAIAQRSLQLIQNKKYDAIRSAHVKEYQGYFNTLSIDLGSSSNAKLPTDERISAYTHQSDPSLITLYTQYARYLLISSSRPGTHPANLQGIWNNLLTPPWGSKYTTNINAEMNYWPVHLLNIAPCQEPFFSMIQEVAEAGKLTAKEHYGAKGWVLHHNTDVWRGTAPINAANHGIWVTGGAWLCNQLWDQYLFTQDLEFLKRAYPIMKGSAEFFVDFLVKDPKTGWLISTPSNSPEQGGLVAGPAMDHQIIRELFENCATASLLLNKDESFRNTIQTMRTQIAPDQIGKHGQLQEWLEDKDEVTNRHRHVSHLWAVYPGSEINWDTSPELMKAARQSLLYRGDGGTGWSLAWKVNLWARFKDGDHTLLMIDKLLEPAELSSGKEKGGVYANLFDAHPPFQIDGNFGGAAGIAEMLVQSHLGYIELLPALPSSLQKGVIKGVCTRGAFELTIQWSESKLTAVEVISKAGGECILKYGDKQIKFTAAKGKIYKLNGDLKLL